MIRAIDVSVHQGDIDWMAVAGSGVRAAWIKCGGADTGWYRDSRYAVNCLGADAAGIPRGAYYFAFPAIGNALNQAGHAVGCGLGQGQLPPVLDLEAANGLTGRQLDEWALVFLAEVERQTGRRPIVYTGRWVGSEATGYFGTDARLARYPLWIANYGRANTPSPYPPGDYAPAIPPAWSRWDIWQHCSTLRVPGIRVNTVDSDAVTDGFWATITSEQPIPEGWAMKRILIQGEADQWRLCDDAHGVLRRQRIDSLELVAVLDAAGVTDGEVVLTDPAQIARFRNIPATGTVTAEIGLINVVAKGVSTVQQSLAGELAGGQIDPVAVADAIAHHLSEHLAG